MIHGINFFLLLNIVWILVKEQKGHRVLCGSSTHTYIQRAHTHTFLNLTREGNLNTKRVQNVRILFSQMIKIKVLHFNLPFDANWSLFVYWQFQDLEPLQASGFYVNEYQ